MYEIDFLAVESDEGKGSKSGDAIAIRFSHGYGYVVVVIDAGFTEVGGRLADSIETHYGTSHVDLVISTHPDQDHLNGIQTILERLDVDELFIHQPANHFSSLTDFSNLEALNEVLATARTQGVTITEPFTGEERFDGKIRVLGPTLAYYEEQIAADLEKKRLERLGLAASYAPSVTKSLLGSMTDLLEKKLPNMPIETLTDEGDVSGRNNSSVVTLLDVDGQRTLFTGDAGADALDQAADRYEAVIGPFATYPLTKFQVPHHGSRRNVGPTILDRILGPRGSEGKGFAYVSSAKIDKKHPSPKVVNAVRRRGYPAIATEGQSLHTGHEKPNRDGWTTVQPIPPLSEDD